MVNVDDVSGPRFVDIVGSLRLALFVFQRQRLIYQNQAAAALVARLRADYNTELLVTLVDHQRAVGNGNAPSEPVVTLLTAANGETFCVHTTMLGTLESGCTVVTVRELGSERDVFSSHYRLSKREMQVAALALRGYGNYDIASALGIAETTVKKHLTRIFDKVGVDSRAQLIVRLA